jgi:hypothetical protein
MKTKKYWILVAIAAISLTGLWGIDAVGDFRDFINSKTHVVIDQQEVLMGLVGVTPKVAIISMGVQCNLTKNELQTQVELRLRQSGIKVFPEQSEKDFNSLSGLSVRVDLGTYEPLAPAYYVGSYVKLLEPIVLVRNPQMVTSATTWEALPVHSELLREIPTETEILEVVNRSVDQFINDYLAANPKK